MTCGANVEGKLLTAQTSGSIPARFSLAELQRNAAFTRQNEQPGWLLPRERGGPVQAADARENFREYSGQPPVEPRMKMTINVDEIRVASPCNARWNDMDGDERARFCGQCSKHVFNLSAMTRVQIETLVREKEGKFCGRFYRRTDGRMLTADCPSRLRHIRERMAKIGGALCALVLSLAGCSSRRTDANHGEKTGRVLMGDVAVPPVVCATNPTPPIMGIIALPEPPPPPSTNSRVLMGEISIPPDTNSLVPTGPDASGK